MSNENIKKHFWLTNLSIDNKVSVYVLVFIIFIVGLTSYNSMPKESFPEIVQPTIYVGTPYPGNSPVDMENLVTRPIEKEIKTLKGLKKFTSTSIQDFSSIIVEFEPDVDPTKALQDVKDAVDKAKNELPRDLPADPNVFELDFSEFPIMNVNLSGDVSYEQLKEAAEYLEEEFEKVQEVSGVDIRGLLEKEVKINIDRYKMEAMKISFFDVENAITSENVTISGGDILSIEGDNQSRRSIRVAGEFTSPEQILDVIVKDENQEIVYLRDIADVVFGPVEPNSFARLDGNQVVTLDVKKKSGENLINGVDKVKEILAKAKEEKLPKNMKYVITNDQSINTRDMVNNLENSIISGIILVVLVLLYFMGVRNSMFVGVAIPLSMLMGIGILNFMGTSLNMMVLFSLILALGMLVDNGIVIVENVYRMYVSEGKNIVDASREGSGEVAVPIISSTLTTLAAFFPLLFWNSLIGEFMKYLPITLIIVLSSSLFVALVVNPVLTANFMKKEGENEKITPTKKFWVINIVLIIIGVIGFIAGSNTFGNLLVLTAIIRVLTRYHFKPASQKFQANGLVKLENTYERFVRFALSGSMPIIIFIGSFVLLIGSFIFFGATNPKFTFFPENEPQYVNVFIEMPIGTDIEKTNSFTKELENVVQKAIQPNRNIVEAVLTQVGEGTGDPNEGVQQGSSPNKARITVTFIKTEDRVKISDTLTSRVLIAIQDAVQGFPEANITVAKNREGPPVGKPINIEVSGENYDSLITYATLIKNKMVEANIPGVDRLKLDLETGKPEAIVKINRDAARRYGISTAQIAQTLRTGLFGKEISKYKEGEDDYEIWLRLKDEMRYDLNTLINQKITFRNPSNGQIVQVPISAVVEIENSSTFGSVKRKDMNKVISIFSEVKQGYNANEIVGKFKELLAQEKLPAGYEFKFTGEQEEQNESSAFLGRAFGIAFLLIFLIIVSQFNSIINPLIIMFSVIFSTIGVFLGFGIFKMDFVILMCGIGIISLAGVVVNNAIVLIDYTNLVRARKRRELGIPDDGRLPENEIFEAIVEAGKTRLRPVLLTAITTVLGLVPLAIGLNINFFTLLSDFNPQIYMGGDSAIFWGPMSWTVIFGLTFATFLTLVVVPAMYLLSDRLTNWFKKL